MAEVQTPGTETHARSQWRAVTTALAWVGLLFGVEQVLITAQVG